MVIIGIGEMAVSNQPGEVLVTYSLGSCIGLSVFDPVAHCGGLIHCKLPLARQGGERPDCPPGLFVDTGLVALLQRVCRLGARTERLVARLAGGAGLLDPDGFFRIGQKNCEVARRVLAKNQIRLASEDTGGDTPRTMYLHLTDGRSVLRAGGREFTL